MAFHNDPTAGHYGVERTLHRIAARYYWPTMRKDVRLYVGKCIECQRYKNSNLKPAGLFHGNAVYQRFEIIAIDLFDPLPSTIDGMKHILIIEDIVSR